MVESRLEGGEGWPSVVCVWWAVTFQGEERTHEEAARGTSVAAAAGAHGRQRGGEVRAFYTRCKLHQESRTLNRRRNFLGIKMIKQ